MAGNAPSFPAPMRGAARGIALPGGSTGQGHAQFLLQFREIALYPAFPPDQHVIVIGQTASRQCLAQQGAEAALHPVADDSVADLLGDGDAVADALPIIGPGQQDETGPRNAQPAIGREEIRAARQYRERRREAASDLRQ